MKNIRILFLIVFSFVAILSSFGAESQPLINSDHKQIYLFLGNIGTKSDSIIRRYNIKSLFLIGGRAIDPKDEGYLHVESLKIEIKRVIPEANSTGLAILDWEGKAMDQLTSLPLTDSGFNRILNQYKQMVEVAKELRPNIQWGIYSLPPRNYWRRDSAWQARAFMLIPLLKECDILTPSVYDFYPDSLLKIQNKLYIEDNVRLALKIGNELNKPVYAFVTHRWQNLKAIPKDQFVSHIDYIFKTQYLNDKVAGIVWWGPDEYYYKLPKDNELKRELKSEETFSDYFDNLVYQYLSAILQLRSFWNK